MNGLVPVQKNGLIYFPKGTALSDIVAALPRANSAQIGKAVVILFTGLKAAEGTDLQATITSEVYRSVMADYPAFAIEAAVQAFIRGEVPDASPTFVPSTAELHRQIKYQMWRRIRLEKDIAEPVQRVVPAKHFSKRWQSLRRETVDKAVAAVRARQQKPEAEPEPQPKQEIRKFDSVKTINGDALVKALDRTMDKTGKAGQ